MTSYREAPRIGSSPAAESAWVSVHPGPDATVTVVAAFHPGSGTDLAEFGDDVRYEIHLDVAGRPALTYQFRFRTELRDARTFLYNTGPIDSLDSPAWNRRQFYSVTRVDATGKHTVLARRLACPPCHGRAVPDYPGLAGRAVHLLPSGEQVFAGQPAADPAVHTLRVRLPLALLPGGGPVGVRSWAARRQIEFGPDEISVGPFQPVGAPAVGAFSR